MLADEVFVVPMTVENGVGERSEKEESGYLRLLDLEANPLNGRELLFGEVQDEAAVDRQYRRWGRKGWRDAPGQVLEHLVSTEIRVVDMRVFVGCGSGCGEFWR